MMFHPSVTMWTKLLSAKILISQLGGIFCRISLTIRLSSPPPYHLLKELQFGYMWMWQWTLLRFWYWFASLTWTSIPAKCSPKQTHQTTSTTVQVVWIHQDSFLKWNIGVQSTKTNQLKPAPASTIFVGWIFQDEVINWPHHTWTDTPWHSKLSSLLGSINSSTFAVAKFRSKLKLRRFSGKITPRQVEVFYNQIESWS